MTTAITRVAFCEECYKKNLPKVGSIFIVYCTNSDAFRILKAERDGQRGFTPHTFYLHRASDQSVEATVMCCIHNCDIRIKNPKEFIVLNKKQVILPIKDWVALISFKRDPDYHI